MDTKVTPKEIGNARRAIKSGENAGHRTRNGEDKVEFEIAVMMEIERRKKTPCKSSQSFFVSLKVSHG